MKQADQGISAPFGAELLSFAPAVREMMAKVTTWTGSASDPYRIGAGRSPDGCSASSSGWPKSPRALAGRLRRVQTSLRALGIEGGYQLVGAAARANKRLDDRF
jgi:hypothetical protein